MEDALAASAGLTVMDVVISDCYFWTAVCMCEKDRPVGTVCV